MIYSRKTFKCIYFLAQDVILKWNSSLTALSPCTYMQNAFTKSLLHFASFHNLGTNSSANCDHMLAWSLQGGVCLTGRKWHFHKWVFFNILLVLWRFLVSTSLSFSAARVSHYSNPLLGVNAEVSPPKPSLSSLLHGWFCCWFKFWLVLPLPPKCRLSREGISHGCMGCKGWKMHLARKAVPNL